MDQHESRRRDKLKTFRTLNNAVGAILEWRAGALGTFGAYMYLFQDRRDAYAAILGFIVAIFQRDLDILPMGVAALMEIGTSIDSIDQSLKQTEENGDSPQESNDSAIF